MFFVIFCCAMYFLPSIVGRDKRSFVGIFLVNCFLGWTVIGWICALVWACTADVRVPLLAVPGPGRYCCHCGARGPNAARFCWACGAHVYDNLEIAR